MKLRLVIVGLVVSLGIATRLPAQEEHPNRATGLREQTLYSSSGQDDVNLFNGNLHYRIPVGEPVAVGPLLSIAPALVYNSQASRMWSYCKDTWEYPTGDRPIGHGWRLHFGRLAPVRISLPHFPFNCDDVIPGTEATTTGSPVAGMISARWGYEDPDGGVHELYDRLTEATCDVTDTSCEATHPPDCFDPAAHGSGHCFAYTHDSSFIRVDPIDPEHGGLPTVYFPDGTFRVMGFRGGRYPATGISLPPDLHFADPVTPYHTTLVGDLFGNQFTVQYYGDGTTGSLAHPLAAYGVPQNQWDAIPYRVFPSSPWTPYTPLFASVVFRFDVDTFEYQPEPRFPAVRAPRMTQIVTPTAAQDAGAWLTASWVLAHSVTDLSGLTLPTLPSQQGLSYLFSYGPNGLASVRLPSNGSIQYTYGTITHWTRQPSFHFDGVNIDRGFKADSTWGVTERRTERWLKTGVGASLAPEVSTTVYSRSYEVENACSATARQNCRLRVDVWSPRVFANEPYKVVRSVFGESDQNVNTPLYARVLEVRDYAVVTSVPDRTAIDAATPFRTTTYSYAFDGPTNPLVPSEGVGYGTNHNTRTRETLTLWAGHAIRTTNEGWDGIGHWGITRHAETSGGVTKELKRVQETHLNLVSNSSTGSRWILDPVTSRTVARDPGVGPSPDPAGTNLSTTETHDYDGDGFGYRDVVASDDPGDTRVRTTTRTRGTATVGACFPSGSATFECANLGRAALETVLLTGSLDTTAATGASAPVPVSSSYTRAFYYRFGTLAVVNDSGMPFLATDRDIAPTGKVVGHRGTEGRTSATSPTTSLTTTIAYDLLGRVVSTQPPGEGPETVTYGAQWSLRVKSTGTGAEAGRTRVFFDQLGRPTVELRRMPGSAWSFRIRTLDGAGRDAGMTEWQSRTCANAADPCPELIDLQALVDSSTFTSTPAGTVFYDFDELERPRKRKLADGSIFETQRQGWWQETSTSLVKTAFGPGSPSVYTYQRDSLGRLTRVDEPATFNADGQAMNPAEETVYVYDAADRLVRADKSGSDEHAGASVTQTRTRRYDDFGWVVVADDPEAKGVTESRDARGLPLRTWDGQNRILRTYDGAGRHVSSEREGEEPPYDWDGQPARWYEVNAYDGLPGFDFGRSNGRLVWSFRANHPVSNRGTLDFGWFGVSGFYHYSDGYGRLSFRQQSDYLMPEPALPAPTGAAAALAKKPVPTRDALRSYFESQGRKATRKADLFRGVTSASAAVTEQLGSPSSPTGVARWSYGWDGAGRMSSITYPRRDEGYATTVTTTYDGEWPSVVTAVIKDPFKAGTVDTVKANLSYSANGRVTGTEVRTKAGTTLALKVLAPDDPWGLPRPASWSFYRASDAAGSPWESRSFSYDPSGNIASISSTRTPGHPDAYTYDARGRLVRDDLGVRQVNPESREYDGFGNPTRVLGPSPADLATNRSTNRLASSLAWYDAAGRLTEDVSRNLGRDYYPDGALTTEFSHAPGSNDSLYPAGNSVWMVNGRSETALSFWGDALNCNSGTFASSLRDEGARLLSQYRSEFVDPACTCATGCSVLDRYAKDFVRLGPWVTGIYERGVGLRLEARDHLGSPRVVTNDKGVVQAWVILDSFGLGLTGMAASQEMFTGHERNHVLRDGPLLPVSDYMHARTYVPMLGRFTRPDPANSFSLLEPQSLNRYAYARNNPLKFVDPDGREAAVALGLRTDRNIAGHVSLIVNGRVYSFGTNWTHGAPGIRDWGASAAAYLQAQNGKRVTELHYLKTTPTQEAKLVQVLEAKNPNAPGANKYDIVTNSCVTVAERALENSGILPNAPGPERMDSGGNLLQSGAPESLTPASLVGQVTDADLVQTVETVGTPPSTNWFQSLWSTVRELLR